MPWFNVDDGFANSKPVMRIPRRYRAASIGVWTLCGSWSAKELTDGFIPQEVVEEYGGTPRIVDWLISAGLWELADNDGTTGLRFRNWSKWQRTKQQVVDYRAAEAERKRNRRNATRRSVDQQERETSDKRPAGTPNGLPAGHHADSDLPIPKPEPTPKPVVVAEGGERTSVGAHPETPPPRFCKKHMPTGTLEKCGACADARRTYDAWLLAQSAEHRSRIERRAAELVEQRRAAAATRQDAIDNCTLCDQYGYFGGGTIVCDHVDRTNTARAGIAAVRAALGQPHKLDEECL